MISKRENGVKVSVVVPARNEAGTVGACVRAVRNMLKSYYAHEVIVVDDKSSDGTVSEARKAGASVLKVPKGIWTVAGLRNYGVSQSCGDIVIFLDADVVVTEPWGRRFHTVANDIERDGDIITGSRCMVPDDPSWIEKHWFAKKRERGTYLGSGHLIIARPLFCELGGFDDELSSGEDYDLCRRARQYGARVRPDRRLAAIHLGFPQTIRQFARRELWHGAGDAKTLRHVLRSKVATVAIGFCGMLLLLAVGGLIGEVALAGTGLLGALGIIVAAGMTQLERLSMRDWLYITPLYCVYFLARTVAVIREIGRGTEV